VTRESRSGRLRQAAIVAALLFGAFVPVALAAGAPQNTVAPAITGQFFVGNVITVSSGTWSGSPTTFLYQFIRCTAVCNPTGGYAPIAPASTSNTYKLTTADAGNQLYALVQATNASGSTVVRAFPTPVIGAANGTATTTTTQTTQVAPKAVIRASWKGGRTESLSAAASVAHLPATKLKSFKWRFGDGKTGTGERIVHRYPKRGTYKVKLTVTDNLGVSASVTRTIHVG